MLEEQHEPLQHGLAKRSSGRLKMNANMPLALRPKRAIETARNAK